MNNAVHICQKFIRIAKSSKPTKMFENYENNFIHIFKYRCNETSASVNFLVLNTYTTHTSKPSSKTFFLCTSVNMNCIRNLVRDKISFDIKINPKFRQQWKDLKWGELFKISVSQIYFKFFSIIFICINHVLYMCRWRKQKR